MQTPYCCLHELHTFFVADKSICESLGKLNSEYPLVDSPAKIGSETPAADVNKSAAGVLSDLPLFDRTRLFCPPVGFWNSSFRGTNSPADGSGVRAESTTDPLYDSTPLQRDTHRSCCD